MAFYKRNKRAPMKKSNGRGKYPVVPGGSHI